MPTTSTTPALDRFVDAVRCAHGGPSAWAEGAVLDAVVPGWRLSVSGTDRIHRQMRHWFSGPWHVGELRRLPITNSEVIELTVDWTEHGVAYAPCQVRILELDRNRLIARDNIWCGGRRAAMLLAEMEAERDAD